jgi:hypothetical protein
MPRIATENHFTFVRSNVLNRPTAIEHQIASRIATAIDPLRNQNNDDSLVRIPINRELTSFHYLVMHYTHEERFRTCNAKKASTLARFMLYPIILCHFTCHTMGKKLSIRLKIYFTIVEKTHFFNIRKQIWEKLGRISRF